MIVRIKQRHFRTVVLNKRQFGLRWDIQQCLVTFWLSSLVGRCYWHLVGRGQGFGHMHRTASYNKELLGPK